jgi:hypothetical protein
MVKFVMSGTLKLHGIRKEIAPGSLAVRADAADDESLFFSPEARQRRFERGGTEFNEGRSHKRFEYGYLTEPSQAQANAHSLSNHR